MKNQRRSTRHPNVFLGHRANPITTIQKAFKQACHKAGITDFRFHDLRHTFAGHLVMNGADLATVKELLGHKSKAVDSLEQALNGHYMDTTPEMAVNADFGNVRKGLSSEEKVWHAWQDSNLRPTD